jgi:hypothetical protein
MRSSGGHERIVATLRDQLNPRPMSQNPPDGCEGADARVVSAVDTVQVALSAIEREEGQIGDAGQDVDLLPGSRAGIHSRARAT